MRLPASVGLVSTSLVVNQNRGAGFRKRSSGRRRAGFLQLGLHDAMRTPPRPRRSRKLAR
jgi:hypothetical protein